MLKSLRHGGGERSGRRRRNADRVRLGVEGLEGRIVLAAGIGYDRVSRTLNIVGSTGNDSAEVRQRGTELVVWLNMVAGRSARTMTTTVSAAMVSRISFMGLNGNDSFTNLTAITCRADGGAGADVLRGGSAADVLVGGDGRDQLLGEGGSDVIDAGAGNDIAAGGAGNDRLMGGLGQDALQGGDGTDSLWGGSGDDRVEGGSDNDSVFGEDGSDVLRGGSGADSINGGEGNDRLDGELGIDKLVGGPGLDREDDAQDRFADGDVDSDGFDNDHDVRDIFFENGNPSIYADDATVAATIEAVSAKLREALGISADDKGLRVRVAKQQSGDLVTGVWRYLTADKIQLYANWCFPASDVAQLNGFAQYQYKGPYSGSPADYSNPANYAVTEESRLYAGYLNGSITFVSWIPNQPAGWFYTAPNAQATGSPAPIAPLTAALASMPNFSNVGDSFQGTFSNDPGFKGVQPVLGLLRTINQVNEAWYATLREDQLGLDPPTPVTR